MSSNIHALDRDTDALEMAEGAPSAYLLYGGGRNIEHPAPSNPGRDPNQPAWTDFPPAMRSRCPLFMRCLRLLAKEDPSVLVVFGHLYKLVEIAWSTSFGAGSIDGFRLSHEWDQFANEVSHGTGDFPTFGDMVDELAEWMIFQAAARGFAGYEEDSNESDDDDDNPNEENDADGNANQRDNVNPDEDDGNDNGPNGQNDVDANERDNVDPNEGDDADALGFNIDRAWLEEATLVEQLENLDHLW